MKNIFKNKVVAIIILLATLVLAGVAVFTAIRLFQLRNESVAPNAPTSEPAAVENPDGILPRRDPTPSPVNAPDRANSCTLLAFVLTSSGASPSPSPSGNVSPSPSPSSAASPSPSASPTPPASCNNSCSTNSDCQSGLVCSNGACKNASCTSDSDCVCATPTPTPSSPGGGAEATPTPTPTLPDAGVGAPTIIGAGLGILLILGALLLAL